jgi:MoCo/4Fe-4S cofactor protein with predicted Tat translocation signal
MRHPETEKIDLRAIRARLESAQGRDYWRSLEEVGGTPEFQDYLAHEFPENADTWTDPVSRRSFLQLMGASFALAGLAACGRQPIEMIVPYVDQPENLVPGKPLFYATAFTHRGYGLGVLAESHMGRPTKIEGNPQHPASLGATDALAQASVLTLYDPDRSQVVRGQGLIGTWDGFVNAATVALAERRLHKGEGLRLLTGTVTSPTLAAQIATLLEQYPAARWHQYEAVSRDAVRAGARLAFGADLEVRYDFTRADVILTLDSDPLFEAPGSVRYARDFAERRRVRKGGTASMNRLYAVESSPTITGAMADHRLPLRAGRIEAVARAVAAGLGVAGAAAAAAAAGGPFAPGEQRFIDAVTRDLRAHRGAAVVVPGETQPPVVHVLAHLINQVLDGAGRTVLYTDPVEARPLDQTASLRELADDMQAGRVAMLVIAGGNPAYDAPADLDFAGRLAQVPLRVHLGLYEDETSELCHWHLPETHPLETWSDVRAYDGTVTIQQPLIAPLYDARSAHQLLGALLARADKSSHDEVKEYWSRRHGRKDTFEAFWRTSVHDGVVAGTALAPRTVTVRDGALARARAARPAAVGGAASEAAAAAGLEVLFRPDPTIGDGRYANNGWLQELPKPLTKLTWDNAALLSPTTAERLALQTGDVVELRRAGRKVKAPVFILPGHADEAVTVHLGYGRRRTGRVGSGAGFDAYRLRTSEAPGFSGGLELRKTGATQALATTQHHQSMEGRRLLRVGTLQEFRHDPGFALEAGHDPDPALTLHPPYTTDGPSWGMAIDLGACIGCNACVASCQAENNSPIVGRDQVLRGREMHWIRIDRYYNGDLDNPGTYHEPVLCMHCQNAPCEPVCPVGATVHSTDGLNQMIYNRCVGTRYCSNNCPYKVRRFNFLQYSDVTTPSRKLGYNPDVTVRNRGVMEKCSYCVQRISGARITAEKESRDIRDGEVVTACQAACPTQAIVFGNVNDPKSRVSQEKAQPLNYGLLTELNTRPRTTYLARLRNPNPELETAPEPGPEQG